MLENTKQKFSKQEKMRALRATVMIGGLFQDQHKISNAADSIPCEIESAAFFCIQRDRKNFAVTRPMPRTNADTASHIQALPLAAALSVPF